MSRPDSDFGQLISIMKLLRAPEGCPWDKKQTHRTLYKYLVEETYELIDAINEDDSESIKDELGDVLLQVVFHAQIASEKNEFTITDVIKNLCEKLVRRHPHIFGNKKITSAEEVILNWEKIKKQEKQKAKKTLSVLEDIPSGLPPIQKAEKIQKKVNRQGFDWKDSSGPLNKIYEELNELAEELASPDPKASAVEEEVGDVLFSMVNYARHLDVVPSDALEKTNRKFVKRYSLMETFIATDKKKFESLSLQELDEYWEKAKNLLAKNG
ncbi:MAG: nucleoside triphosphate pyrophosphohydrolase [Fibrobacteria bacterium]|nr:nucleoside triphosphate pyrophosphohydrolase [Fibrobacteria bacterium]